MPMDERVLILIVLVATAIPCAISYGLVRFVPRARYLPSVLLAIAGLGVFFSAVGTKPTGGGISGFGDLPIYAELVIGGLLFFASGVAFVLSFLMYKWWRSRHGG